MQTRRRQHAQRGAPGGAWVGATGEITIDETTAAQESLAGATGGALRRAAGGALRRAAGGARTRWPRVKLRLAVPTDIGALAADSLALLLEHAIVGLDVLVANGSRGKSDRSQRRAFSTLLESLPVACKQLAEAARMHPALHHLVFFERARHGRIGKKFCLEGAPPSLRLMDGPSNYFICEASAKKIRVRDVSKLLQHRAVELDATHASRRKQVAPSGVTETLILRSRATMQAACRCRPSSHVQICQNALCGCSFLVGSAADRWAGAPVCDDEDESSTYYWAIASGHSGDSIPLHFRFCSSTCATEHARCVEILFPQRNLDVDDDVEAPHGRHRVDPALRAALKRNSKESRSLREIVVRRGLAVSEEEIVARAHARVTALNVDVAILYASSTLAASRALARGRLLPGSVPWWRCDSEYYGKILRAAVECHFANRQRTVVTTVLSPPCFMQRLICRIVKLF